MGLVSLPLNPQVVLPSHLEVQHIVHLMVLLIILLEVLTVLALLVLVLLVLVLLVLVLLVLASLIQYNFNYIVFGYTENMRYTDFFT